MMTDTLWLDLLASALPTLWILQALGTWRGLQVFDLPDGSAARSKIRFCCSGTGREFATIERLGQDRGDGDPGVAAALTQGGNGSAVDDAEQVAHQ